MKYPIGIQTFSQIIENGFVYVDKTDMVYSLATEGKVYFLSRPRRFGKSLLLSTLRSYFEGKKDLFKGLKIDALEKDWHQHKVFHIDFNGTNFTVPGALNMKIEGYIHDWEKEYDITPEVDFGLGSRFEKILKVASEKSGRGVVVLIDEYDKPLLDVLERDPDLLDRNREILKAFYSVFKQSDAYLRFVFLTGVTKFSQISVFSGFNQPLDISMSEKYESLCGITEEELLSYFAEPIREMADSEGCTEEEMQKLLKQRYDGYHFGKSLLLSTLRSYFEGNKDLFKGLKIDALEKDWHQHKVFHIDFNGTNFTVPGALNMKIEGYIHDWEKEYDITPEVDFELGSRFEKILKAASEKSGRGVVVLIDEYDKPLLDVLERDQELLNRNRETLKAFYSVFKRSDAYLRFVFLTGVTKLSQISVFSGFNQPLDISMSEKYEALCGITEEELLSYFAEPIREMAESEGCTEDEMQQLLEQRYDGYHFGKTMTDIYNPFSLLNAFYNKDIRDYWFASGTPTYLIRLMNHFNEGIDQLTGKYYSLDEFVNYKADTEYPLPMIYQSGYLTIKDYERDMGLFLLDFPNNEVKSGFLTMVATNYLQ